MRPHEAGREAVAHEEFGDLVGAERGHPYRGDIGAAQEVPHRGSALDAFGDEHPDAGRGEAQREAEQVGALGVEPLGVVEDEQDGVAGGERTEHFDDGEAQRDVVAAGAGGVGLAAQEGDGGALGAGELFQSGAGDGGEQGGGRGLGYPLVGGLGGEAQHGLAARFGRRRDGADDLGLARAAWVRSAAPGRAWSARGRPP